MFSGWSIVVEVDVEFCTNFFIQPLGSLFFQFTRSFCLKIENWTLLQWDFFAPRKRTTIIFRSLSISLIFHVSIDIICYRFYTINITMKRKETKIKYLNDVRHTDFICMAVVCSQQIMSFFFVCFSFCAAYLCVNVIHSIVCIHVLSSKTRY